MSLHIDRELGKFIERVENLDKIMNVRKVCDYAYILSPKGSATPAPAPKKIALTLSGTIHGNETVGVAVLNEFLGLLASRTIDCRVPLAIFVGNPKAAHAGTRFLERDLNRSFASKGDSLEEKRSRELLPILADTMWFVDLHQTNRPAEEPFFIFPYSKGSFAFAKSISPQTIIVTHVDDGFSTEGLCSDEFVNKEGGVGITLECGQVGLHPLQIAYGLKTVLNALSFVHRTLAKQAEPELDPYPAKVYLVKETLACPQQGVIKLKENLNNLQDVKEGDLLAEIDGKAVLSPRSGKLLFPNYATQTAAPGKRPSELMRVIAEGNPEA